MGNKKRDIKMGRQETKCEHKSELRTKRAASHGNVGSRCKWHRNIYYNFIFKHGAWLYNENQYTTQSRRHIR